MEGNTRKKKVGIALLVLALLLPLFLGSSLGLGMLEDYALKHAPEDWAASLDMKVAGFYGITLRSEAQKGVCERFLQTFTTDRRRGYAKFCIARCIQKDPNTANHHILAAYEEFLNEYYDDPNSQEYVKEAERAIASIKNN